MLFLKRLLRHQKGESMLSWLFGIVCVAAWLTHLYVSIGKSWAFFITGALLFPVGIIHGIGVWLGLW